MTARWSPWALARLTLWIVLATWLTGCGLGEKIFDPCQSIRASRDMLSQKASSMQGRGPEPTDPYYQLTTRELRRVGDQLSRCETRFHDPPQSRMRSE